MTIRKNFTMSEQIVGNLEFLATAMHKKQSRVIQELIQEKMQEFEKENKLKAVKKMSGMFTGAIDEDPAIQSIKANREN